ncbi:hypothetical protein HA450_23170 [Xanthomonas citri pv. punicae]|nr:hypothetical protein [Xanthomonas citri pv. punicae]
MLDNIHLKIVSYKNRNSYFSGQYKRKERGVMMARGKDFEHKKKHHPGPLPEGVRKHTHAEDAPEDEEFIVTQEAFKNRIEED